jgi:hypothetical protein
MVKPSSDASMPPRRGRRIVAERIWTRVENPGATVIEANRSDGWYRSVDGAQEPSMVKLAHRVLRIFDISPRSNGRHR